MSRVKEGQGGRRSMLMGRVGLNFDKASDMRVVFVSSSSKTLARSPTELSDRIRN
jgi:hypothetical protein